MYSPNMKSTLPQSIQDYSDKKQVQGFKIKMSTPSKTKLPIAQEKNKPQNLISIAINAKGMQNPGVSTQRTSIAIQANTNSSSKELHTIEKSLSKQQLHQLAEVNVDLSAQDSRYKRMFEQQTLTLLDNPKQSTKHISLNVPDDYTQCSSKYPFKLPDIDSNKSKSEQKIKNISSTRSFATVNQTKYPNNLQSSSMPISNHLSSMHSLHDSNLGFEPTQNKHQKDLMRSQSVVNEYVRKKSRLFGVHDDCGMDLNSLLDFKEHKVESSNQDSQSIIAGMQQEFKRSSSIKQFEGIPTKRLTQSTSKSKFGILSTIHEPSDHYEPLSTRLKRYKAEEQPIFNDVKYNIQPRSSTNFVKAKAKPSFSVQYDAERNISKIQENIKSVKHHFHKVKGNQPFTKFVEHADNDFAKPKKFDIDNLEEPVRNFYETLKTDYAQVHLDLAPHLAKKFAPPKQSYSFKNPALENRLNPFEREKLMKKMMKLRFVEDSESTNLAVNFMFEFLDDPQMPRLNVDHQTKQLASELERLSKYHSMECDLAKTIGSVVAQKVIEWRDVHRQQRAQIEQIKAMGTVADLELIKKIEVELKDTAYQARLDQFVVDPEKGLGRLCEYACHYLKRMNVPEEEFFQKQINYRLYLQALDRKADDPSQYASSPSMRPMGQTLTMAGVTLAMDHDQQKVMPIKPKAIQVKSQANPVIPKQGYRKYQTQRKESNDTLKSSGTNLMQSPAKFSYSKTSLIQSPTKTISTDY